MDSKHLNDAVENIQKAMLICSPAIQPDPWANQEF